MSHPGRLLLLSPAFHGYWQSVEASAQRRGYDVTSHVYDQHTHLARRLMVKGNEALEMLGHSPAEATRSRATDFAISVLVDVDPDVVLVIKGDQFDVRFWDHLAAHRSRTVLWLYDELRRTDLVDDAFSSVDAIASYSPEDVAQLVEQGFATIHLPLAYDPQITITPVSRDEVVFVGARYPQREDLLTTLAGFGVPVRAYGRDWSSHPWDRLRTWRLGSPDLQHGRDLDRASAYGVMAGARAALNIHGDQDGFTMRTFEAAGVGALQLIDRDDVSRHYEPGVELLSFTCAEEAADLAGRAARDRAWANAIREAGRRRTLAMHTFDHRLAALDDLWV